MSNNDDVERRGRRRNRSSSPPSHHHHHTSSATSFQQSSSLSSSVVPTSIIPHNNQDSSIQTMHQEFMFEITLNSSDVVKDANHVIIPNHHAEKYFPPPGVHLSFEDESGISWTFRYSYWPPCRNYVFTRGWSSYIKDKKLETDDVVLFLRHLSDSKSFFIRYRRNRSSDQNNNNNNPTNNQNQSVLQSSLEHTDGKEEQRRRKRKRNNGGLIIKDNNNDDIHLSTNTTNTNTSVEDGSTIMVGIDRSPSPVDLSVLEFDPDPADSASVQQGSPNNNDENQQQAYVGSAPSAGHQG